MDTNWLQRPWWLGVLILINAVLFYFGFTGDAVVIHTKVVKEFLGVSIPLLDERATYSIFSAIVQLWKDGNTVLFVAIFLFSIIFPVVKLAGNALVWGRLMAAGGGTDGGGMATAARWLHTFGRWSMIEVFVAAGLCVFVKIREVVDVYFEAGLYFFLAAVVLSIVNALLTEHLAKKSGEEHGAQPSEAA